MSKNKLLKEITAAEQRCDWRQVATLSNALGSQRQAAGDLQGALHHHQQERRACMLLNDALGEGVAHRRIGEVFFELGDTDKALEHQQQHLQLAVRADSLLEQQRAYATIGRTQLDRVERAGTPAERDEAVGAASENFIKALHVCKQLPNGSVTPEELALMRCRLYLNLGLVADHKNDATKALGLLTQAATLARQHSFQDDLYRCHFALTATYFKQRKFGLALEEAKHTVTLSAKLDNFEKIDAQKFLGRIYLSVGNISEAKRAFTAAYKVNVSNKDAYDLKKLLKATIELCKLKTIETEDLPPEELLHHFEKIADLYAHVKCPEKAIEYYQKVVDRASTMGKSAEDMAPIYYSIAQTFDDNAQWEKAREYYQKEYDVRLLNEPKEACRTLLAIASTAEQLQETSHDLQQYYRTALQLAKRAQCPKLMVHVLKLHASIQDISEDVKTELESETRAILNQHGLDSDCELSEDEEEPPMETDLSLSESETEEEEVISSSRRSNIVTCKKDIHQPNNFGETTLHKACINGDLKKARLLVKNGHVVNIRDKAGWLPLHEACNHGHLEIVDFLLSVGAHINDRGGKECSGLTPIHDAAACGHLAIVRLLMERGASVITKNDDGETPLECLLANKKRAQNLSQSDLDEYAQVEALLKDAMIKAGYKADLTALSSQAVQKDKKKSSQTRRLSDDFSSSNSFDEEQETSSCVSVSNNDTAVSRYRRAITGLGSAAARTPFPDIPDSQVTPGAQKKAKTGLIDESEFVGENDFFEQDVEIPVRKRKRPLSKSPLEFHNQNKERKLFRDHTSRSVVRKPFPKKTKQTKLTNIMDFTRSSSAVGRFDVSDDDHRLDIDLPPIERIPDNIVAERNNLDADRSLDKRIHQASTCSASNSVTNGTVTTSDADSGKPLRLRVKVEDKTLLVPISEGSSECSIEWLAKEVSLRYYQLAGIRPEISLATSDGAILHPNDPITLVLGSGQDQLVATVSGWELPPLHQRYAHDCLQGRQVACLGITEALIKAESSGCLEVPNWTRCSAHLRLVIRSVQRHQGLHTLVLAHTRLADEGFSALLSVLPSLPGLSALDVKGCGITKKALTEWTEKIDSGEFNRSSLTDVDLSYNTLQGCTLNNIYSLLSLPNVCSFDFSHCYLVIQPISSSKNFPSLHTLKLDYNTLYPSALKQLLSSVPSLKRLSLRGLKSRLDSNNGIGPALSNLLGSGESCHLEHLDLGHTNLSRSDLDTIRSYFYRCLNLTHLDLSHNNQLGADILVSILSELNASMPLMSVHFHGIGPCKESSDLLRTLLDTIRIKCSLQKSLKSLSFSSFHDSNSVLDCWISIFEDKCTVNTVGKDVFLEGVY